MSAARKTKASLTPCRIMIAAPWAKGGVQRIAALRVDGSVVAVHNSYPGGKCDKHEWTATHAPTGLRFPTYWFDSRTRADMVTLVRLFLTMVDQKVLAKSAPKSKRSAWLFEMERAWKTALGAHPQTERMRLTLAKPAAKRAGKGK